MTWAVPRTVIARVVDGELSQAEWDGFGRYAETPPDRGMLERFSFLDDADHELVEGHRGTHSRLGFVLQAAIRKFSLGY